jgi:hypothetical protein
MVGIYWDYGEPSTTWSKHHITKSIEHIENCRPPSNVPGYIVANNIRRAANTFGCVNIFKAYFDFSQSSSARALSLRSELQTSGVSLTDCPHNGRKDVADNMILGASALSDTLVETHQNVYPSGHVDLRHGQYTARHHHVDHR